MIEFYRVRSNGDVLALNRANATRSGAVPGMLGTMYHGQMVVASGHVTPDYLEHECYAISAADALSHNGRVYARAVLVWAGYPIRHTV